MPYMPFSFLKPWKSEEDEMSSPYRKILFDALPASSDTEIESPKKDLTSIYSQLSGLDDTPELTAYKEHLGQMPTLANTKVGGMTKLAAALTGVSEGYYKGAGAGIGAAQGVAQTPYRRSLQEWGQKAENLGTLATLGRQSMMDRVNLYKASEQARLDAQKFDLQVKQAEDLMKTRAVTREKTQAEINKIREDAKLAGYREVKDQSTGLARLVHPISGHSIDLGRFDESAADKRKADVAKSVSIFTQEEATRQQNRLALEDVQLTNSKAMEGVRQENRVKLQELQTTANKNRDLARANAANSRSGANLLNQNKQAAQSIINSDIPAFRDMGISIDKGNIVVDQDKLDLNDPAKMAKYVALMNTMYKGVQGAATLSMPKGYDEFGNKTSKYTIKRD